MLISQLQFSDLQKRVMEQMGCTIPVVFNCTDDRYWREIDHAATQHPDESSAMIEARAIARIVYEQQKRTKQETAKAPVSYRRELWAIIALLALLCLLTGRANAQIDVIQLQSGGSNVKTVAAPFKINCGTGTSCSFSSNTFTITATGVEGTVYYQTLQNATTGLTQRTVLNFLGGIACADNSGASRTDCTLSTDTAVTNQYVTGVTAGVLTRKQVAYSEVSGTPSLATVATSGDYADLTGKPQLAQTKTAVASNWLRSFDATTGLFAESQPACADLSDDGSLCSASSVTDAQVPNNITVDLATAATSLGTGADRTKLDGIAAGAEVNVNADWTSVAGDSQILNKPNLVDSMAEVVALWTSCISGYLKYDGTCDTPSAGGAAWGSITGTLSSQTDLQTALDGKVDENGAITGATKTKITYDAKGLVTGGADATTADIADSTNKRYVTDAQLTVIGNTSGTNTGDQDLSTLVPKTTTVAGKALSSNITIACGDLSDDGTTCPSSPDGSTLEISGTTLQVKDAGITAPKTATAVRRKTITCYIGADNGSALADTDDMTDAFRAPEAMHVTAVYADSDAGSPTVNVTKNTATNVLSSNLTATQAFATSSSFTAGADAFAAGDILGCIVVSAGGTAKRITIQIDATRD